MSLLSSLKKTANGLVATFKDGSQKIVAEVEMINIDVSSSGNFSASQPLLKLTKVGNLVVLNFPVLVHGSNSAPISAAGVIPARFRPLVDTYTIHEMSSGRVVVARALDDGSFGFVYRDWAGSFVAQTTCLSGSISWIRI